MSRPLPASCRWLAFSLVLAGLLLLATTPAEATYTFVTKWGASNPSGISTAKGIVYVSDDQDDIVRAFSDTGTFDHLWHTGNAVPDVAVSGNTAYTTLAACCGDDGIAKFNASTGAFLGSFGPGGSGDGKTWFPQSVATNANGSIVYVTNAGNHRIQTFTSAGDWLGAWGGQGGTDGRFNAPAGIAVAPNGNVYVADKFNKRIQEFTPGGDFIRKWPMPSGSASSPVAVAVDSHGLVYVVDNLDNDRILKFNANGGYLETIGRGRLDEPSDVAIDAVGNVYVTGYDDQVRKWAFVKEPPRSLIAPTIKGQPHVGSTLTCDKGTWGGSLPIAYTYGWLRNRVLIPGATGARYVPTSADKGKNLRCQVTTKNAYGTATKQSAAVNVT
jgi:hypothetical protein